MSESEYLDEPEYGLRTCNEADCAHFDEINLCRLS